MKTKLIKKHQKNCCAVKSVKRGDWESPWFFNTYKFHTCTHIRADKRCGNTGDTYRWVKMGCNNPDCDAQMAIRVDVIEDLAEQLLNN